MTISHEQARAFYDHFGSRQGWPRFYKVPARWKLWHHARIAQLGLSSEVVVAMAI